MSNKLTQTQISTTQSRPDCWQCPGPSSLDCDKMNLENFSRKVVVCWYPTRRYWLDISDYTRYIPRVFTDGYRDHPKDGSSSTSHMKFWQEAEVEYKKLNLWYCSDGDHDHQWAATEEEPAQDMSCSVSSVSSAPVPLTRRSHLYLVLDSETI